MENTEILRKDYKFITERVKERDFVYLDPPYVRTKSSQFIQYNHNTFSDRELNELEKVTFSISERNTYVMLTNRYCEAVLERFPGFNRKILENSWTVNRDGGNRKGQMEILLMNY